MVFTKGMAKELSITLEKQNEEFSTQNKELSEKLEMK